ncbi:MAG: chemotaxis protein CheB [Desulfobacterales bacterium]
MGDTRIIEAVVIGASAGGFGALPQVLAALPANFPAPVIIAQHMHPHSHDGFLTDTLDSKCLLQVKEAEEKEVLKAGIIYLAPANYHLLIEKDKTLSLSTEDKVNYSRPSIDVLFESAAEVFGRRMVGVILTGGNSDGAAGLKKVKAVGGLTLVQDPEGAEAATMPRAAIENCHVDRVLPLADLGKALVENVDCG